MTNTMKTVILSLAGLSLFATLAIAQGHAEGRKRGTPGEPELRSGHATRFEHRGQASGRARFDRARKFIRSMDFTEAQRALVRQEAAAIAPAARSARDEVRAIRDAARARAQTGDAEGARKEARAQLEVLRERTGREFAPHGRVLVESLSPEQRARIEERLAARGKTFDVERASRRIGRWLARPGMQERMRDRGDTGPRTGR